MSKVELSRRGFLKGTLAATGAAMAGTAAHAGDIPEKWQQPKCSGWSWEKPAAKIAPEQIKKTVDTDVVVIGAGLAGFAAALAAAQEGAKVVLVEKTRGWSCRGGHITAFNSSLQKKMGIDIDAAEIVRRLVAWGQGRMDERLLWMFARKVRRLHGLGHRHRRQTRHKRDAVGRLLQRSDIHRVPRHALLL